MDQKNTPTNKHTHIENLKSWVANTNNLIRKAQSDIQNIKSDLLHHSDYRRILIAGLHNGLAGDIGIEVVSLKKLVADSDAVIKELEVCKRYVRRWIIYWEVEVVVLKFRLAVAKQSRGMRVDLWIPHARL